MIELGSELIGNWNNGCVIWRYEPKNANSPQNLLHPTNPNLAWTLVPVQPIELGQLLFQFARAIRQSTHGANLKIGLTSTFDFKGTFMNFGGNTMVTAGFQQLAQQLSLGGNCLIDYINVHNYPINEHDAYSPNKVSSLLGINDQFESKYLTQIKNGLEAAGCNCKLIITESNAAAHSNSQEMNFFTEGMYAAQTFATVANQRGDAITPFAFCKEVGVSLPSISTQFDPTTNVDVVDDIRFNLLFYNNNSFINQSYTSIFFNLYLW